MEQQQLVSVGAVESNRERLLNLIDLKALKPELQGRPVLAPFLKSTWTSASSTEREEVNRLLVFVTSSGHLQAVNALTGALQAEKTHPGHEEAFKLLVESSTALASSADAISGDVSEVLKECIPSIEEKLDFNALSPIFLQRGIITQDVFMSWQGPYISPSEKAESLVKSIESLGMKGLVDFSISLQAVPNDQHQSVVAEIAEKIQGIAGNDPGAFPKDQTELLTKAGILISSSSTVSPGTMIGSQTSALATDKKDRIAVIISMETYYSRADVKCKLSIRDRNGRLLTEKRKELEGLFEDLGCSSVVNVTEEIASRDVSSSEIVQEVFNSKVNTLCNKNTQVLLCVLGLAYHLKGEGMALLLRDKVDFPLKSQCLTEKQLAKGLMSLPTLFITVMIDCFWPYHDDNMKLLSSANPWQSLCPWNSRTVVYHTALHSTVTGLKTEYNPDYQHYGLLSDCLIKSVRRWHSRGQSEKVTHLNIFNIISMLWDQASQAVPCVKGDVDRVWLGCNNIPLPYHFMGCSVISQQSYIVSMQCGSCAGFVPGEDVHLFHAFVPERVVSGIVSSVTKFTCIVTVTNEGEWSAILADVQKNDLGGKQEQKSFIGVYKQLDDEEGCSVDLQVSDTVIEEELLSFMGSFNAIFGRKDRGTVLVKYSGGQLEVTSRNVKTVRRVSSVQLAKSMIARTVINECTRRTWTSFDEGYFESVPLIGCYLYPQQDKPLLSKQKFEANAFSMISSVHHKQCPPENALCEFDEENYWSPDLSRNPNAFLTVEFPQNVYLTAVEVRGCPSMPKFIASGYFVYSQSLVHVCDEYQRVRKRFEGPTHYKRNVSVKLSSIDPLNQGVVLPWCEDVRSIEIDPLTNGAHKRKFFSLKFYHSVNDQEIPITEYQLGDEYPGYSFSHQPKGNRIITLDSSDQWLTVKYPVAPICPLYLGVNFKSELPKMRLSRLELRIPDDLLDSDEFESPKMFDLKLKGPLQTLNIRQLPTGDILPSITCSSFMPEKLSLPLPISCCTVQIRPVPSQYSICLQCQMFGHPSSSDIEMLEGDLLQTTVCYSSRQELFLVVLCIEDTGAVSIIENCTLQAGSNMKHQKLIRTFIPEGFSTVDDLYKFIISNFPLNVASLEQNGCVNYHSTCAYNTGLVSTPKQVKQVKEWWRTYNYKVKIKSRYRAD